MASRRKPKKLPEPTAYEAMTDDEAYVATEMTRLLARFGHSIAVLARSRGVDKAETTFEAADYDVTLIATKKRRALRG